jgi:putative membrane protein
VGSDSSPRFTLADERTVLAWNRTALALIAGGLAAAKFLTVAADGLALIVAVALTAFGGYMSLTSYPRWQSTDRALRLGQPRPPSALPRFLSAGGGAFAVVAAALAVLFIFPVTRRAR